MGRVRLPKQMIIRKITKRPLNPPPSFSENHVAIIFRKSCLKAMLKGPKSAKTFFGLKMTYPPFGTFPINHVFFFLVLPF